MPLGDGTGPYGTGPGMGWHRGRCYDGPVNWPFWRGTRTNLSAKEELRYLKDQESMIQNFLMEIRERRKELSNTSK